MCRSLFLLFKKKTAYEVRISDCSSDVCSSDLLVVSATNDGLPAFLTGNEDGTDSGFMIVQYTAAALVNDLATRAHPASVYSVPTSANAEDHVSMGANEARHVLDMVAEDRKSTRLNSSH